MEISAGLRLTKLKESNMYKIFALLKLRGKQLFRMIDKIGWLLFIIFLFVIVGVGLQTLNSLLNFPSIMSIAISFTGLITIDFLRRDKVFLASIFQSYPTLVRYIWIENVLIVLPVIIYQCMIGNTWFAIGIVLAAFLVALLSPLYQKSETTHIKRSIKWLPIHIFELRFFAEKLGILTYSYLVFGLFSFLHIGVYAVWILLFCFTLPEVFKWNESREMVHWKSSFVINKVLDNFIIVAKLVLLPTMIALIFHPEMWYLIVYLIFCLFTIIFLCISFKYALFTTVFEATLASNVIFIMLMLVLLPGGVLITLIYAIIQYLKAEKNMTSLYA